MSDEVTVTDLAVSDHSVKPARTDVDEAVVEFHGKYDAGMLFHEVDQRGSKVKTAKADGRRETKRAGQLPMTLGQLVATILGLLQDSASPGQKRAAILRQRQLAGGAVGKPPAKLALELGKAFADN